MSSSPNPEGNLLPPNGYAEAPKPPVPDYTREVAQPRSRRMDILATPGTYLLLAINCAVFLWMVLHGVPAREPSIDQLVHYGATNAGYIMSGQWWRLLTATFVHVGIIHFATNMWCLWNLGLLGEPLLGPVGLLHRLYSHWRRWKPALTRLQRYLAPRLRRRRSLRCRLRHRRHPHRPALQPQAPYPLARTQASPPISRPIRHPQPRHRHRSQLHQHRQHRQLRPRRRLPLRPRSRRPPRPPHDLRPHPLPPASEAHLRRRSLCPLPLRLRHLQTPPLTLLQTKKGGAEAPPLSSF